MKATDLGPVPVKIVRNPKGDIILTSHIDRDQCVYYAVLNNRSSYKIHYQMHKYLRDKGELLHNCVLVSYYEAHQWLCKFCAHHKVDPKNFQLMTYMGSPMQETFVSHTYEEVKNNPRIKKRKRRQAWIT